MNKQIEALKKAIEALEDANALVLSEWGDKDKYGDALLSCKKALEQPAQEPVAYADYERGTCYLIGTPIPKDEIANPLYTHPAQPLSDDEINELWKESCEDVRGLNLGFTTQQHYFAWLIEQAHGIGVKDD